MTVAWGNLRGWGRSWLRLRWVCPKPLQAMSCRKNIRTIKAREGIMSHGARQSWKGTEGPQVYSAHPEESEFWGPPVCRMMGVDTDICL